jgi:hypothetical protein
MAIAAIVSLPEGDPLAPWHHTAMPRRGPALPLMRTTACARSIESLMRVGLNDGNRRPCTLDRIAGDWLP